MRLFLSLAATAQTTAMIFSMLIGAIILGCFLAVARLPVPLLSATVGLLMLVPQIALYVPRTMK